MGDKLEQKERKKPRIEMALGEKLHRICGSVPFSAGLPSVIGTPAQHPCVDGWWVGNFSAHWWVRLDEATVFLVSIFGRLMPLRLHAPPHSL